MSTDDRETRGDVCVGNESEDEDLDPFDLLDGMGAENECNATSMVEANCINVDLSDKKWSDDDQQVEEIDAEDVQLGSLPSSKFWERQDSSPTLFGSLSRHLHCLQTRGFKLPWLCQVCQSINASWFGACEDCKSTNSHYNTAAMALTKDRHNPAGNDDKDHVLLELARCRGMQEVEACFLMCEALAVSPARGVSLYRRAFRLWPALDSYLYPDGVPECLRTEADAVLASRPSDTATIAIFPKDFETPLSIACRSDGDVGEPNSEKDERVMSHVAVVFSYHQEDSTRLGKWWDQALRSASSLRSVHRNLQAVLHVLSNAETKRHDKQGVFDEHVLIDLAEEAQLPGKGRALCGTKIQAIIHCLEQGYKKVIFMDTDTHILRPFLSPMLSALEFYDVTGVFEGPPLGMAQTGLDPLLEDPLNQEFGYELNTGVLGVRASALMLCRAWLDEFRMHVRKYASVSSADQPALMKVLRQRSERVFPLPPTLNFRPFSVFSPTGPSVPAIIHDHADDCHEAHKQVVEAVCSHMHYGLRWK